MKIMRSEIKKIVKECLIEILNEGLAGTLQPTQQLKATGLANTQTVFSEKSRMSAQQAPRQQSPSLREAVRREAGGNKMMESILADTASSTLPKMLQNERPNMSPPANGGVAEQVVASASPEDLFGEDVASKWADLAFMSSPTKK
jgi:hypothetical protein